MYVRNVDMYFFVILFSCGSLVDMKHLVLICFKTTNFLLKKIWYLSVTSFYASSI